jgi:hypothetical protein
MAKYDLSKTIKIKFNPAESNYEDEGVKLKDVWANEMARTFYLAYASCHIRSQYFLLGCLRFGELMAKRPPKDPSYLYTLIHDAMYKDAPMGPPCDREFAEALWPYVTGKKKISYAIVS